MRLLQHRPPRLSLSRPWTTVEHERRPEAPAPDVHPFDPRPFHPHHLQHLPPHIGGSGTCAAEESDPESFPWIPADASNQLPRSFLSLGKVLPIKAARRKAFGLDDEGGGARGPSACKRASEVHERRVQGVRDGGMRVERSWDEHQMRRGNQPATDRSWRIEPCDEPAAPKTWTLEFERGEVRV